MTEATLVSVIMVLCGGPTASVGNYHTLKENVHIANDAKEARIACFEDYVNCGVNLKGILTMQEFMKKCVDPKRGNN